MKKLLIMLPALFITIAVLAQQTVNDVNAGKYKAYGNFKGVDISANPKIQADLDRNAKPYKGSSTITGIVLKLGWCEEDCITFWVKKDDGTTVEVGTKDFGFAVPKAIVGKRITIEGIESAKLLLQKTTVKKEFQKDIQFAATGVMVLN